MVNMGSNSTCVSPLYYSVCMHLDFYFDLYSSREESIHINYDVVYNNVKVDLKLKVYYSLPIIIQTCKKFEKITSNGTLNLKKTELGLSER